MTGRVIEPYWTADGALALARTWRADDEIESPLLPGLAIDLAEVFRSPIG